MTKDITNQVTMKTLIQGQNRILEMITKNKPLQTVLDSITLLFEMFITPSIGISVYPLHGTDTNTLLKKADAAMYQAKKAGGKNLKVHDPSLENAEKEE